MTASPRDRARDALDSAVYALAALVGCLAAGYLFALLAGPIRRGSMLPWLAGRSLGLAAYVSLTALTAIGTWIRHPWRHRWPVLHPEVRVRVHATLGAATVLLVATHLIALASDRFAGVGWTGALIPGLSRYRTTAVALGVLALFAMLLVSVTAALAGRLGSGQWLAVHRLAVPVWVSGWLHGVLAGTDTAALRLVYAATGASVLALLASRVLATSDTAIAGAHRPTTPDFRP